MIVNMLVVITLDVVKTILLSRNTFRYAYSFVCLVNKEFYVIHFSIRPESISTTWKIIDGSILILRLSVPLIGSLKTIQIQINVKNYLKYNKIKLNRKSDNDDSKTDSQKQLRYYDKAYFLEQLKNAPKIPGRAYQKACGANNCTILPTTIFPPDKSTSKFFRLAPPPDHPWYEPQYNHFSAHPILSSPVPPSNLWHSECNPFCKQLMTHNNLMQLQELSLSSFITHDPTFNDDVKYSDDDCSIDSFLDYY